MRTLLALIGLLALSLGNAATTITYQGQLQDGSGPYTGTADMTFELYDNDEGGSLIAGPLVKGAVNVVDGLFQVELDFGVGTFDGSARFLEIEVADATISPRQRITGSPWSQHALSVAAESAGAPIIQTRMPAPADPGSVWMRLDEAGTEIWEHNLHSNDVNSVFERNGVVYSGSRDNSVIAVDVIDGSRLWLHNLHSSDVNSVFERNGVVYSGSADGTVTAADASDGSLLWRHSLHSASVRSVFKHNSVVYSGANDTSVIAVDASDGSLLWQHEFHSNAVRSVFERNGVVYSGCGDGIVVAARASNGALRWSEQHQGALAPGVLSVFERNDVVYSGGSSVVAADANDGSPLWHHSLHSEGWVNSVFERNGVLYSGGDDKAVIAAHAIDGSLLWQHSLHSYAVRSVFERNGVVYSGSESFFTAPATVIAATTAPATHISDGSQWLLQSWLSPLDDD